jgi:uncharacterized membrane protein YbaN (DUF454 family)
MSSRPKVKRVLQIVWASFLIIIGFVGMILPFAPGIPFLLLGLYFLWPEWYKKSYVKIRAKFKERHPPKAP